MNIINLITKLINKPAYDALITQSKMMNVLTLEQWVSKMPAGTYNIKNLGTISLIRDDGHIMLTCTTSESHDLLSCHLVYDQHGIKDCYVIDNDYECTFLRKTKYYKASDENNSIPDNIEKTKASIDGIAKMISYIGIDFFHNDEISLT
jgi:hypothetical protein